MAVKTLNNVGTSSIKNLFALATSAVSLFNGMAWTAGGAADPQLQFFENIAGKYDAGVAYSNRRLSVHAVNIPMSISFNNVLVRISFSSSAGSSWMGDLQFGLYSLNGSTLSLANSASASVNESGTNDIWISMVTSATQNITPGQWYFAYNMFTSGAGAHTSASIRMNSSFNPGNAQPFFVMGRMTASTTNMPASIATSNLDITGSDSIRQPFIILTA